MGVTEISGFGIKGQNAGLFGLQHSNRDFSKAENWGKNVFNNAFPVALSCYMGSKHVKPVYIRLDPTKNGKNLTKQEKIDVREVFGASPHSHLYFALEQSYSPYEEFSIGPPPRTDLVVFEIGANINQPLRPLEIKLTALPDNSTAEREDESDWGCEIVIRPTTVVYAALSIASGFFDRKHILKDLLGAGGLNSNRLRDGRELLMSKAQLIGNLENILTESYDHEVPLLLEPVWKTKGKKLILADKCFDVFVWSNLAFVRLLLDRATEDHRRTVGRHLTSLSWLYHMLLEFSENSRADFDGITRQIIYETRSDKAFSVNGSVTNKYMKSAELASPRISKEAVGEIILGGGQNLLSPERRLDAAILSTPGLFD